MQCFYRRGTTILYEKTCRFLWSLVVVAALVAIAFPAHAIKPDMKGPKQPHAKAINEENAHSDVSGWVSLSLIRFFQQHISPIDGPRCQFSPTCSSYGHQAVQQQGALSGIVMTADRLMRCTYWSERSRYVRLPSGHLSDPLSENLLEE